jgi:uncharacterized protein YqfA (UPF0365 family)
MASTESTPPSPRIGVRFGGVEVEPKEKTKVEANIARLTNGS